MFQSCKLSPELTTLLYKSLIQFKPHYKYIFVFIRIVMLKASIIFFLIICHNVHADNSIGETAKELTNDSKRATENAVRVAKDKTCEMVKGKMECAIQKAKHVMQKANAEVEDIID